MKKNIIITVLLFIIILLILFIISNKRIVIHNDIEEANTTNKTTSNNAAENTTELQSEHSVETTYKTSVVSKDKKIIVIDPGHQSKGNSEKEPVAPGALETKSKVSSGTTGILTGTPEFLINLQVSLKLKDELENRGYSVIMTRETNDVNISNAERASVANNANADAFIRIHCNGTNNQSVKGALTMCQSENSPYCGNLYNESLSLSKNILNSLCSKTGAENKGVIETDTMSGINWSKVPVTIVEMGFLTNSNEDKLLNDAAYQSKLSSGIADGIDTYFQNLN